jgi:hypothetical protein
LLRLEARRRAEPFSIIEMTALAVDDQLPTDALVGDHARARELDAPQGIRHVPLASLPRFVDFTVFVPKRLPRNSSCDVTIRDGGGRGGMAASVQIVYTLRGDEAFLWMMESPEPIPGPDLPTEVWRQEGEMAIAEDDSGDNPKYKVALLRAGTHVRLSSGGLSKAEVARLARGLVPLPAEPPRLIPTDAGRQS